MNLDGSVVLSAYSTAVVAPNATATFTPMFSGPFGFKIDVTNDDTDENPYDMTISGTGNDRPTVVLSGPTGARSVQFTVSGMELQDCVLRNGTVSNLVSVSPSVYTVW